MRSQRRYTYADYEQAKRAWLSLHPDASPAEYQAAMADIANRMGL